jgi:enoyl-CoA hydratase/carnithine racemase
MYNYHNWIVERDDRTHIAKISINRPDRMNIFDIPSLDELKDLSEKVNSDESIWAIVVQGQGNHFSAGMDMDILKQITEVSISDFESNMKHMQNCFDVFENINKPIIAQIKGFCMGAGLIFSQCCDFRIASEKSVFCMPLVKLGLTVLMGTQRISRATGIHRANEIVLLGEKFNASKALEYGLLNRVVEPDHLNDTVQKLADKFTRLAPRTIGITKQVIKKGYYMGLRESQDLEIRMQTQIMDSPDLREALQSFTESRKPAFTGK